MFGGREFNSRRLLQSIKGDKDMSEEKLTVEEVTERVETEGLGYAVQHYLGRDVNSEDKKLNKLWKQAYDALEALQDYLPVDW